MIRYSFTGDFWRMGLPSSHMTTTMQLVRNHSLTSFNIYTPRVVLVRVHNSLYRINHYTVDSVLCFVYPVDSIILPLNNRALVIRQVWFQILTKNLTGRKMFRARSGEGSESFPPLFWNIHDQDFFSKPTISPHSLSHVHNRRKLRIQSLQGFLVSVLVKQHKWLLFFLRGL